MAVYKMKCFHCGTNLTGYNDSNLNGEKTSRFECYECGSVYEYVPVNNIYVKEDETKQIAIVKPKRKKRIA